MTCVNIHMEPDDYSVVKCQNTLQVFTVTSITQLLCSCSHFYYSHFEDVHCHLLNSYFVHVNCHSITQLLSSC